MAANLYPNGTSVDIYTVNEISAQWEGLLSYLYFWAEDNHTLTYVPGEPPVEEQDQWMLNLKDNIQQMVARIKNTHHNIRIATNEAQRREAYKLFKHEANPWLNLEILFSELSGSLRNNAVIEIMNNVGSRGRIKWLDSYNNITRAETSMLEWIQHTCSVLGIQAYVE